MKKTILILFTTLLFCFPMNVKAQIITSADGQISVDVPSYWYKTLGLKTPGVEQLLGVAANKDTAIFVFKDTNYVLPYNSIAEIPPNIYATFRNEQIQKILNKYSGSYIKSAENETLFCYYGLAIGANTLYKGNKFELLMFLFIKDRSLHTVLACGPFGSHEMIETYAALSTLRIK